MNGAHLQSIYRYPIKGFREQGLPEVHLVSGQGIAFDRFLGFANGLRDSNGSGAALM